MNNAGGGAGAIRREIAKVRAWLAEESPEPWVVESSGSTGTPKRILLSADAVDASVELSARRVGARGPWLLALPPAYVAGLNVITRSLGAGFEPTVLDEHASLTEAVHAMPGGPRFASMVPTQVLRYLNDEADARALTAFHTILIGGGPVDVGLRRRAQAVGVNLVATYGSAETCGGCVYDGLPLDGVALAIGTDGRVRLSGPTLADGYTDEALTAETFVDGWYLTSDAGRLDEDGRLQILGRLDDMVVTGGVNVPAAVVAARLREHPTVAAAEVLGVLDEEWGSRLVAFVVAAGEHTISLDALRDWTGEVHPRSWAPRELHLLHTLPLLPNGKPDRLALRALVSTSSTN